MNTTLLIVAGCQPLCDLAAADELDTLLTLAPEIRVLVPDMVRHELIMKIERPGAPDALEWIRAHDGNRLSVQSTEEFEEFLVLKRGSNSESAGTRSELSAAEVLGRQLARGADAVILLIDDASVEHAHFLNQLPENVLTLSTSGYLRKLKNRQIRQLVSNLLNRFVAIGRPSPYQ